MTPEHKALVEALTRKAETDGLLSVEDIRSVAESLSAQSAQPQAGEAVAEQIADAVLSWMVKFDLLDAGNEYGPEDVLAVLNDLAPASQQPANPAQHRRGGGLRDVLDADKIATWPPLKKAIWDVVTFEQLNDGHYINAYDLTDKLHFAVTAADPAQGVSEAIGRAVVEAINALRLEHTGRAYDILHETLTAAISAGPAKSIDGDIQVETVDDRICLILNSDSDGLTAIFDNARATELRDKLNLAIGAGGQAVALREVRQRVAECLAGMTHDDVSPRARRKLDAALAQEAGREHHSGRYRQR